MKKKSVRRMTIHQRSTVRLAYGLALPDEPWEQLVVDVEISVPRSTTERDHERSLQAGYAYMEKNMKSITTGLMKVLKRNSPTKNKSTKKRQQKRKKR